MAEYNSAPSKEGFTSHVRRSLLGTTTGADFVPISITNPLPTTTVIGDIAVNSINVNAYIGKPVGVNGDFVTTRTAATQFTCGTLPAGVAAIKMEDIETIRQIDNTGTVVKTYSRDDAAITCSGTDPTTVTVAAANFAATDTIILYTNIVKPTVEIQNVIAGTSAALDLTSVTRTYTRAFTKAFKVAYVLINFTTGQSRDITISLNDGVASYALLTDTGDTTNGAYIWVPTFNLIGLSTYTIITTFSQTLAACSATVKVVSEDE